MQNEDLTVLVPKGYKVNVQEAADLSEGDKRVPDNRHVVLKGGSELKVAIRKVDNAVAAKSSVVLMCG